MAYSTDSLKDASTSIEGKAERRRTETNFRSCTLEVSKSFMYASILCNLSFREFVEMLTNQLKLAGSTGATKSVENRREEILRMAFPAAHHVPPIDITEDQDEFPSIKYWSKRSFKEPKGDTSDAKFPVKFMFMEDDFGDRITSERLDQIRSHLHSAFGEIRREDRKMLADSWLDNKKDLIQCCYNELQQCFKEFNYCDGWKPCQFMIHWYSNFIRDRSRKKGHKEVKRESDNDDDNSTTIPSKRRTSNPNVRPVPTKKVKKEIDANHDSVPMIIDPLSVIQHCCHRPVAADLF